MRRSVLAPRLAVLLCVTGAASWSACSGDRDFFGDPAPAAGRFSTAGSSGAGANRGGETSAGGASAGSAGQDGARGGLGGSGGDAAAGDTSSCGASGEAGESGAGGSPPDGDAGEANGGAGISGSTNEAGAPNQAGAGGDDPVGGTSGSGGNHPSGGTSGSGGNHPSGGASGFGGASGGGGFTNHGGASGSGGIDPGGGSGGVQVTTCHDDRDCQSDAEYCKKSTCAAGAGVCAPRPAACRGPDATLAPVCGCDAMTYFSACVAAREGVNVASAGECNTETAAACTRAAGGDSCVPRRKLARCYRPRVSCDQHSPTRGTCWVLPDECPAAEPTDAYYCGGPSGSTGCFGVCALLEREDSMVRDSAECK